MSNSTFDRLRQTRAARIVAVYSGTAWGIFEIIDKPARGKKCEAIEGLIDEGKEIMEDFKGAPALDAGLLAAAQAVEHYEISRYGTLRTWAEALGHSQAVKLLDQTLMEEKNTDATLTEIALAVANPEAQQAAE